MSIDKIIIYIITFFMVVGGIDRILGNKYGFGQKFEEGFMSMGPLAISMLGAVSLAPVLARLLEPIVVPIYSWLGADPSVFATTFLAVDMGGYNLSMELATTQEAGLFSGLLLGTIMGPTFCFTIPVALGIIEDEDHQYLARGVLAGLITVPLGVLVGGLLAGFPWQMVILNLIPIILVGGLVAIGIWLVPERLIKGFIKLGDGINIIITLGTVAIIVETLTGLTIIPGMTPISEGIKIVGSITILLAGAFPMVHFIKKTFKEQIIKIGETFKINDTAVVGLITSLAHSIPMFGILKEMDNRGKVINVAFAVSGAFVLGSHLGFTAGSSQKMIIPVIVGKLVSGVGAIAVGGFLMKKNRAQ